MSKRIRIEVEITGSDGSIVATERFSFADNVWTVDNAVKAVKGILEDEYKSSRSLIGHARVIVEREIVL